MSARPSRILLIEDDQSLVALLKRTLQPHGFQLDLATSGAQGLSMAEQGPFDLILLDLGIADLDGCALCHTLSQHTTTPLMTLATSDQALDPALPLTLGAGDHMRVPFNTNELVARLRGLLRHARQPAHAARPKNMRLGELEIDLMTYEVWRQGQEIPLSRIERALLELFLHYANKVVPQRIILQQVWGEAYAQDLDILRVAVNRLRKKLEDDPAHPRYLVTKVGIGYGLLVEPDPAQPSAAPAARPTPARPPAESGLPPRITPLLGRAQELAQLQGLLAQEDVRLLTLSGPGGTGKTRLAQELALSVLARYADGVCFVDLSPIVEPAFVAVALAQKLNLTLIPERPPSEQITEQLWAKQLLLILDNFEQVIEARALVSELLQVPRLQIVITSRVLLRIYGEYEFFVPPLAVATADESMALDALRQLPAVALFAARAQAADPTFQLDAGNAAVVAQICRQLEGLPLAIELAAARIRVLPPELLLERLAHRLTVLTGGPLSMPLRQQALRHTLQWSYDLLEPAEQRLFRQLAVFAGGAPLEAIEAILRADEPAVAPMLDQLSALREKSLVQLAPVRTPGRDGSGTLGVRLSMLETIREYALEQLAASGDYPLLQARHADYYLALAEAAAPALQSAQQNRWLHVLEREHDNVRAALHWALSHADGALALRFVAALWNFWRFHNHQREGRYWAEAALASAAQRASPERAQALYGAGRLAFDLGDYAAAEAFYQQSLDLAQQLEEPALIAHALHGVGEMADLRGDLAQARSHFERSLGLFQGAGSTIGTAWSFDRLAHLAVKEQDYGRSMTLYQESLGLFETLGYHWAIAYQHGNMGEAALLAGALDAACAAFARCVGVLRDIDDHRGLAIYLSGFGEALLARGDLAAARQHLAEGLVFTRELGDSFNAARIEQLLRTLDARDAAPGDAVDDAPPGS